MLAAATLAAAAVLLWWPARPAERLGRLGLTDRGSPLERSAVKAMRAVFEPRSDVIHEALPECAPLVSR